MRQLPDALDRIERTGERGFTETIQHGTDLAAAKVGRGRKLLLRPRPFGALLGHQLLQDPRRKIADRRLTDSQLDVTAYQLSGVRAT